MKITCEKSALLSAVSTAARAIVKRTTLPILEGILLNAADTVSLTGFNLETGVISALDADVLEHGDVVIPAKMFVDIVRKLPDDTATLCSDSSNMVNIKCGKSEFQISGLPAEQFPALPEFDHETGITLPQSMLRNMLAKTLFAVATNESKTVHTGALFELNGGVLTIVALDGFRLAIRREQVKSELSDIKFVVPGKALAEVEHNLISSGDYDVQISAGKHHISFEIGNITVLTRLFEGEFLNYRNAIPSGQPIELTVQTRDLLSSVERVSLLTGDRAKGPVQMTCGDGAISLMTSSSLGRAEDRCICEGNGNDLVIGFNHTYLVDALKAALPDREIKIRLGTHLSPCTISSVTSDSYLFMVLPVRLREEAVKAA